MGVCSSQEEKNDLPDFLNVDNRGRKGSVIKTARLKDGVFTFKVVLLGNKAVGKTS